MSRVLLVNPNRMKPAVGPIGLDYLAGALEAAGHVVDLLDLCFESDCAAAIDACLRRQDPDLIGLSIRNTDDCYFASRESFLPLYRDIFQRLRRAAGHSTPIVLGGVGFSVMPEAILRRCGAEYGIAGDGEESIVEIAKRIDHGQGWLDVAGLVVFGGGFRRNPARLSDLDAPARPRSHVDNLRYFREGGMGNVETKRGCAQACVYCADPLGKGSRYRLRSPRLVVDELELLLSLGIDTVHLCDAEFNLPYAHAAAVCDEIIGRGLGDRLSWYTYAAIQPFDESLASRMLRAGCQGVNFGADSADDSVLARLGRSYRAVDLRATAQACRRQGLTFMYDLLLGGPGETRQTARATIEVMQSIEPARVGAAAGVRIYPGTQLATEVFAAGFHPGNPDLHGSVEGNEDCAEPVFFLAKEFGFDGIGLIHDLVAGDPRFFVGAPKDQIDQNYNYNDNSVLVQAIRSGHRGAYWDILRKLSQS